MKHHATHQTHSKATLVNTLSQRMLSYSAATVIISALLLSASSSHAADTYYKWQEPSGHWTYGAHPPYDAEAIEVKTSSAGRASADADSAESDTNTSQLANKHAEQYAKYCKTAMDNLDALKSDAVIRHRDENGNIVEMSEEEKLLEKENAAQAVELYCKSLN